MKTVGHHSRCAWMWDGLKRFTPYRILCMQELWAKFVANAKRRKVMDVTGFFDEFDVKYEQEHIVGKMADRFPRSRKRKSQKSAQEDRDDAEDGDNAEDGEDSEDAKDGGDSAEASPAKKARVATTSDKNSAASGSMKDAEVSGKDLSEKAAQVIAAKSLVNASPLKSPIDLSSSTKLSLSKPSSANDAKLLAAKFSQTLSKKDAQLLAAKSGKDLSSSTKLSSSKTASLPKLDGAKLSQTLAKGLHDTLISLQSQEPASLSPVGKKRALEIPNAVPRTAASTIPKRATKKN